MHDESLPGAAPESFRRAFHVFGLGSWVLGLGRVWGSASAPPIYALPF